MSSGNSNYFLFLIFILVIVAVVVFFVFKKKKAPVNTTPVKQKKDEVWKSIKHYLKINNEQGKEIIDSYVAKRKTIDFKEWKKENIAEWNEMSQAEQKIKREEFKKDPKELYVVVFTTRNGKTRIEDPPRAIECEIVYARTTNKKDKDSRNIVINGLMDYDTEAKWIDPLRKKDEAKLVKEEKRQAKKEQKKLAKAEKKAKKTRN